MSERRSLEEQLRKMEDRLQSAEEEKVRLQLEFEKEKLEKTDILLRFSELASKKLTQDNPAIVNLSDINRPPKLGEKFSEVYDNEWTDAFEELTSVGGKSERQAIDCLLTTLKDIWKFCVEKREYKFQAMKHIFASEDFRLVGKTEDSRKKAELLDMAIQMITTDATDVHAIRESHNVMAWTVTPVDGYELVDCKVVKGTDYTSQDETKEIQSAGRDSDLTSLITDEAKSFLKSTAVHTIDTMIQSYFETQYPGSTLPEKDNAMSKFQKSCVQLCWLMCVQTPPMTLKFQVPGENGENFDTNMFHPYTTTGRQIEFVVWPLLLLHENGPTVLKGVAQGKKIQHTKK